MNRILATVCVLFISMASFSQTNYYKGMWSDSVDRYYYEGYIKLTVNQQKVEGEIIWTLIVVNETGVNKEAAQIKVGKKGLEKISGTYNPDTKEFNLASTSFADPYRILAKAYYTLKLFANERILYGQTKAVANDPNPGKFHSVRQPYQVASTEFEEIKRKWRL